MKIERNQDGLYVIPIHVRGKKRSSVLKAVIDTGSTDCACDYKVITTLQIRPIDYGPVNILGVTKHLLSYETEVGFDTHGERVPIIRVPEIKDGFNFIFGMSVLSKCNFKQSGNFLDLTWNPTLIS